MRTKTTTTQPTYSTVQVCVAADATYRQLDYWVRIGILAPDRPTCGSGTQRGWAHGDVVAARVACVLSGLGAESTVLRRVVYPVTAEEGRVLVTAAGTIVDPAEGPWDGWLVDVDAARAFVAERLPCEVAVAS